MITAAAVLGTNLHAIVYSKSRLRKAPDNPDKGKKDKEHLWLCKRNYEWIESEACYC